MKTWRNMPGPGDEATWGPCTGHPLDPRTPEEPEIVVEFVYPPIPLRNMDYQAYYEDYPEGPYGYGSTEQSAIDDLRNL
jgi:hypothetical protein